MQYHQNGFRPGSPFSQQPNPFYRRTELPDNVDVLIVGGGPAGLTLAAQLSAFDDLSIAVVERKDGPMQLGQADGIACRTVEMFNAFGFAEAACKEAYWVNETSFWRPDPDEPANIERSNRIQDTEDGLSEFPHLILSQARVHDYYLDLMASRRTPCAPNYGWSLSALTIDEAGVDATVANDAGVERSIRAKYVVGCDGARSAVRQSLGLKLEGDAANKAWGVMDVLAVTDFPDIRLKAAIQSSTDGNVLIIPREGGFLVRLYVEMEKLGVAERVASKNITFEQLTDAARRILHPYSFEVKECPWWSVYEIGQRLCERFDDLDEDAPVDAMPRVFIAGDACHTHSPKAGQGMNVSMQDAFNLGWKLASVLQGQAKPELLKTYSRERQAVAQELIDFDREWSLLFSSGSGSKAPDPAEVQSYFVKHGRYTAGVETRYTSGPLVGGNEHQALAEGFPIGKRFHSAPVIRLADAKPLELGHCHLADGRWRLYAFASADPKSLDPLMTFLERDAASPLNRFGRGLFDVRGIYQQSHRDLDFGKLASLLRPLVGTLGLTDYEKAFCSDLSKDHDIFDLRGINRGAGCMVLVRPDQYVATVLPLTASDALTEFCDGLFTPSKPED